MNTTHNTKTKLLAKAVGVAAAAMLSGGLALAGLGLAPGIAQAEGDCGLWAGITYTGPVLCNTTDDFG